MLCYRLTYCSSTFPLFSQRVENEDEQYVEPYLNIIEAAYNAKGDPQCKTLLDQSYFAMLINPVPSEDNLDAAVSIL